MKIGIIGAGMAGLLAAGMLRDEAEMILESQPSLPNNHSALLRFRSSVVGDVLNIPFRKVRVMKAVDSEGMNPVAAMLAYSLKSNGSATMRSSISASGEISERFVAPTDLVSRMAAKVQCPIYYEKDFGGSKISGCDYIISTMPMRNLMRRLGWDTIPEFTSIPGYNITVRLGSDVDAFCTLYIPNRERAENRISITGDLLTIEAATPHLSFEDLARGMERREERAIDSVSWALSRLGLVNKVTAPAISLGDISVSLQRYAKIRPIDEHTRRQFIIWASEEHGVFSLGRFATWRPGLLLDDVVNDVRVIQRLIAGHSSYEQRKN